MSQLIPDSDGLKLVKERESSMMDGTVPSWLTTATSGGAVTAFDASNGGGYLELDPGTAATDDYAKISTFDLQPDAFDVVEFEARIEATTTNTSDITCVSGFEKGSDNHVLYSWLTGDFEDQIRTTSAGTKTFHDARTINDTQAHDVRLRWDTDSGVVSLETDEFPAVVDASSGLPDSSMTYFGQVTAQYKGGSAAQVRVYRLAVRYYQKSN